MISKINKINQWLQEPVTIDIRKIQDWLNEPITVDLKRVHNWLGQPVTIGTKRLREPMTVSTQEINSTNTQVVSPQKTNMPWERVVQFKKSPFIIYEILPTTGVRNNQTYVLAKVIASLYRRPRDLKSFFEGGNFVTIESPYRFNFRIVMKEKQIGFYIVVPEDRASELIRKVEGIYDRGITINEIKELPQLDSTKAFCTELHYRKHDIFSIATDRDNNYPLPSLLTTVRTLEGDDIAVFDAMLEPAHRGEWLRYAKKAHNMLEKGFIPEQGVGGKLFTSIQQGFYKARDELLEVTRISKSQQEEFKRWKKEQSSVQEAKRIREEMTNSTRRKQDDESLKAWLRIAVQSDDPLRRKTAAYTMANAWKDLTADNELERYDIPTKFIPRCVNAIEERNGFSIRFRPMQVSTEEAGKFLQLPGRSLIEEFPEINSQKYKEVTIPNELTLEDIKGIRIGKVTERGVTKEVKIPLEAYTLKSEKGNNKRIQRKHVYDALCTAMFGQGKQGTGKTEGLGITTAYDMIINGFSSLIIDTADGEMLKSIINSLPEDYPEEKIHVLNFDNKAWPIAGNWSDIYGRNYGDGDEELEALEITERITDRFVQFINSLSNTGDFTDRMQQYVKSCMRAVTTLSSWSFLDLELALISPAYREELLQRSQVQEMSDVVGDLQTLQERAANGKEGEIINPILSRIRTLSGTQFMANIFYQDPKLNNDGTPVLDLRHIMDNPEGGYGHVVAIFASSDAWNDNQATILGFMLDKINFNAFSRVDIIQDERKPCLVWVDEPHKVIKRMEDKLAGTAVEFRKYRVKNMFTGHSIDQMGAAANALLDGGAQVISYKTERLSEFTRFGHKFQPYDDPKALYEALPEKWKAICSVRLPSGKSCPAFLADMTPPPKLVRDRNDIWQKSAEKYGRPWKEVREKIQNKRIKYQELDIEWLQIKRQNAITQKAEEKEAMKRAQANVKQLAQS